MTYAGSTCGASSLARHHRAHDAAIVSRNARRRAAMCAGSARVGLAIATRRTQRGYRRLPVRAARAGGTAVSIEPQSTCRTSRQKWPRLLLGVLALCAAAAVAVGAFVHVQNSHRVLFRPTPPHAAAAQQCHDSGGVSMWRPFHREFVRCDYPDGRRVQAFFYFTEADQ